jgi:ABC-type sugar transport system ATPase subunit
MLDNEKHAAVLEACGVGKSFGGVRALRDVSFDVRSGEVHALMGENGAGKSTLVKLLAGLHRPDAGTVRVRGRRVVFRSPHDALRRGIVMMHQELMPVPELSVSENLLLGRRARSTAARCAVRRAGCSACWSYTCRWTRRCAR